MKLTEKDLDDAILRNREEWDTIEFAETTDPKIELDGIRIAPGCAGTCDQGRRPCTRGCQPMQWADIPSPWRWRIAAGVSAVLVVAIAVAFAGWPA